MLIVRSPSPPVSAFVSSLWYAQNWKPARPRERIMPDGAANLIISLGNGGRSPSAANAIVSGPRSEAIVLRSVQLAETIIGAHFTPGGVASFAYIPVSEIRNSHAPLADLAGSAAAQLREALLEAETASARLHVLEAWLARIARARSGADAAILWAARQLTCPQSRVSDVAEHVGRSARWFAARFERDIGLTPKLFNRVQRFHGALRLARAHAGIDLADLSAAAGYHDQAHLTHEFVRLGGMTPGVLLAARTEHINHIADGD